MASPADRAGCVPADPAAIRRAADLLRAGELVIVPTETVYGVAARADSPAALAKLCAAKGRDEAKRIAFFAANLAAVRATGAQVDEIAARLAAAFWPGPLTLVLPNGAGGWDGFRCPDHPVAQAWLRELAGVVPAVTSANRSGQPPALTAPDRLHGASFPGCAAVIRLVRRSRGSSRRRDPGRPWTCRGQSRCRCGPPCLLS